MSSAIDSGTSIEGDLDDRKREANRASYGRGVADVLDAVSAPQAVAQIQARENYGEAGSAQIENIVSEAAPGHTSGESAW